MAVNFSSSPSIGQTGNLGKEYEIQYSRYKKNQEVFGESSFYGNLVTMGLNEEKVLYKFENDMGYEQGSLSWGRSVGNNDNKNDMLFKDVNGSYAEVNFDKNKYTITSEKALTQSMGFDWTYGKPYSLMTLDQGGMNFYMFTASGLQDGIQDGYSIQREQVGNIKWGLTSIYHQELNPYYLYANDNSEEGLKGQWARRVLMQNASEFLNPGEIATLSAMDEDTGNYNFAQLVYSRLLT